MGTIKLTLENQGNLSARFKDNLSRFNFNHKRSTCHRLLARVKQ